MEGGMMKKRRRVYSVEPRKIIEASFATKYVNYLVPALTKMMSINGDEKEEMVRHEVDMALVLSAQGFAWSHALKQKLQRQLLNLNNNNTIVGCSTSQNALSYNAANVIIDKNHHDYHHQDAMLLNKYNISSNANAAAKESKRVNKRTETQPETCMEAEENNVLMGREEEEEEEESIRRRLKCLRSLLPLGGGSQLTMADDEVLLSETGSYICCLELQVKILRSMVQIN